MTTRSTRSRSPTTDFTAAIALSAQICRELLGALGGHQPVAVADLARLREHPVDHRHLPRDVDPRLPSRTAGHVGRHRRRHSGTLSPSSASRAVDRTHRSGLRPLEVGHQACRSGIGSTCTSSQPSSPHWSRICLVACTINGTVAYSYFVMPVTLAPRRPTSYRGAAEPRRPRASSVRSRAARRPHRGLRAGLPTDVYDVREPAPGRARGTSPSRWCTAASGASSTTAPTPPRSPRRCADDGFHVAASSTAGPGCRAAAGRAPSTAVSAPARRGARRHPPCPDRVVVVGHSAGGHLALWPPPTTRRPGSPGSSRSPAASTSPPSTRLGLSDDAARSLLGGDPDEAPDAWADADPARQRPTPRRWSSSPASSTTSSRRGRRSYVAARAPDEPLRTAVARTPTTSTSSTPGRRVPPRARGDRGAHPHHPLTRSGDGGRGGIRAVGPPSRLDAVATRPPSHAPTGGRAPARRHRQGRHRQDDRGRGPRARPGRQGKRVLLAEVEGRQGISQTFDVPPLGTEEVRLVAARRTAARSAGSRSTPRPPCSSTSRSSTSSAAPAGRWSGSASIDFATTIAPGVRDVLLIGKVYEAVGRTAGTRRHQGRQDLGRRRARRPARPAGSRRSSTSTCEVADLARVGPIHSPGRLDHPDAASTGRASCTS